MKSFNEFKEINWEEDWEEEDPLLLKDLIEKEINNNGLLGIKVSIEDWSDFVDILIKNDIKWGSNRLPEKNDRSLEEYKNHIVILIRKVNGYRMTHADEVSYKERYKYPLFIFENGEFEKV